MDGSAPTIPYPGAIPLVKAGFKTSMATPLVTDGGPIGVLTSSSIHPHAFSDSTLAILERVASYIAIAIANANAFEQTMTRYDEVRRANGRLRNLVRELQKTLQGTEGRGSWARGLEEFTTDMDRAIMPVLGSRARIGLRALSEVRSS